MTRTGVVRSMKDFYWDIRPKPEFGTIEIRVFDTPLTIERAAALAGYVQSLGAWFLAERPFMPAEDDYLVYTYNRFQACRFGLDAVYVDPARGDHMPLREHILMTMDKIAGHAAAHQHLRTPCTCCAPTPRPARTMPAGCATASARNGCWPRSAARRRSAFAAHLLSRPPQPADNQAMGEFDLIARYFTRPVRHAALGVGDDCALLAPRPGMQLAISSDMLVEGRHFFADVDPEALGHKALAVNLRTWRPAGPGRWPSRWHWRCHGSMKPGSLGFPKACWRWPMRTARAGGR